MIYQSLLLNNLLVLCLKIVNSAIVGGLYYGFLTTFSIGPSYVFLIRARVLEEGNETEVSATTGFITGQIMMFISIYYAPLHLALSRPHTIIALTVPYLFFNFVYKNDKHYYSDSGYTLDSEYKNQNSIRNFRIYKVFFNNLFFQLLNPLVFTSSTFIRLINIYLFRCNNKLLFLTSSFVGWLIGHILLMKLIGLILVWLQQKNSIKSKVTMRFDKYILLQLRNYAGQIFVVFSFVLFTFCLGKTPLPYFYTDEILEYDEREMDVDVDEMDIQRQDSETEETEQDKKGSVEEDEYLSTYLFSEKDKTLNNIEEDNNLVPLAKPLVTTLFDYRRWIRPLRYIKNDHFERVVRDENSQFFFHICQSDGKERISFTYPPSLSTFLKMMEKKIDLFTRDKISSNNNELSNYWSSTHNEKRKKLSNEFLKRAQVLDKKYKNKRFKKFFPVDVFETPIRLCNDKKKKKYLTKIYDPLLTGRLRGQIEKGFSPSIINETYTTNNILINKIHGLLLSINSNYPEFEQKIDQFDRKLLLTEIGFFFNLISKFSEKSVSSLNFDGLYLFPEYEQVKIYSEEKKTKKNFLFDAIRTDWNNQTIFNRKKCIGINEISKQVPRWSYNLIDEVEQLTERIVKDAHIRSPRTERIVVFDGNTDSLNLSPQNQNISNTDDNRMPEPDLNHEFALLKYSREPDYSREIIRGSMRPQRRKTVTSKLFQSNVHSPIFLEIIDDYPFFFGDLFDDISQYLKEYFRKPGTDNSEFLDFEKRIEQKNKEDNKDEAERRLREIEESWESILYGLIIRSFVLLTQSIIRKYILLPSLIITKNIIRILLFQNPEWSEDFRDWRKEVHIKCTYQGIPVSQNELPKNWFNDGIQIRVLSPFVLKPWHKSRVRSTEKKKDPLKKKNILSQKNNFWFLTAYGTLIESYLDDHFPNPISFLDPILKKIKKQLKKDLKNRFFLVLNIFNERKTRFRTMLKEIENWNLKSILFRFKKIGELSDSKKIDELSDSKKNSTISENNPMIEESPVIIQSINWTSSSFTEKRIKDLNVKTETIRKQIEKMREEKKEGVINSEKNVNSNKTIYDAKTFELQKNIFQILQRRNVRLTRKFYSFFKVFMESIYIDILLWISSIPRIHGQRFLDFLESTNQIVNKSIYKKKKNEEKIYKTNESIIPFMSVIDKSWNITNMNSQNSCDVSSLSQAYVFFKLAQIQFSNGDKYKLRSIFESHSKLRHKNRPDSLMNQWTNWLKSHYQYHLPQSRWSTLVPQNWRNRINEHRLVQKKELVEYDSYEKSQLILDKKQQVDLLEIKKKIKKQYRYDLFCYQYINYTDNQKSDIYGYRSSPLQANKKEAISYNYNTCKNQLFEIIGDISIENYIAEDYIAEDDIDIMDMEMDMEKNMDRRYLNRMVRNLQRKKNSIPNKKLPNPRFWFFSKLRIFYDAYKKNPWIQPRLIKRLFLEVSGVKNSITALETKEYAREINLKSYSSNHSVSNESFDFDKYRYDLKGERDFLLEKYLGFYLDFDTSLQENLMNNINLYCLMVRLKSVRQFFIMSLQKADLDIESMVVPLMKEDFPLTGYRDNYEFNDELMFIIEPARLSIKNYEQFFIYQTIRLPLIHKSKSKRKILKRKPEKSRVDQKIRETQNHYDLLVPENLLSTRRRRELRILICFNPRNRNTVHRNAINDNENKINNQVLTKNKDRDSETKKLRHLKFFLWPNYRLEDLACINRYWFDTHNGSRFSILRIHMYPRLKN